ncbi:DUF58 domain-containing protein [Actinomadura sp. KC216]|uniref:DUF58 domain-containing protein n=1 Tax=Actinomadura sp. KC216 TaxID=2530370 RepID=UPI001046CFA3|nr:DUF58 domain-containing protein [Actinomadura sp. KC216]TDB88614.1 DUF58 domain-containing protein [Actinomadura sp. KC216]
MLAALAALLLSRPNLLLLAAPPVGVLAAGLAARRPDAVAVRVSERPRRCFEDGAIEITVAADAGGPVDEIALRLAPVPAFGVELTAYTEDHAAGTARAEFAVRPRYWGRHTLPALVVDCRSRYRAGQARTAMPLGEISVYPAGPPVRPRLVPVDLLRRLGDHAARAAGSGTEFAGIRPYLPGDRARDVNWKASGLRGRLHVTTRADQRQAEVVLALDAYTDLGEPGGTLIDRAVRGAAAVATAYLRGGDRVGIVAFGGALRWLAPGQGEHHFYRLAEAVMDARDAGGGATSDLRRVPRTALPPGALVIVFSPLLDDRAVRTVQDLRRRGTPVVVIDTLDREPPGGGRAEYLELSLRLWRLDRRALRHGLADLGVPVVPWAPGEPLDVVVGSFGHRVSGRHS